MFNNSDNESAMDQLNANSTPIAVFRWLQFVQKLLKVAQPDDIKQCQKKLLDQLLFNITQTQQGPVLQELLTDCLGDLLYHSGDACLILDTTNMLYNLLKTKDDNATASAKPCIIRALGNICKKSGKIVGRTGVNIVQQLLRVQRGADAQLKPIILTALKSIVYGMKHLLNPIHKELYKMTKILLIDKVMDVRCAAAECLLEVINSNPQLYTVEMDSFVALCCKAFEGSDYHVRCSIAKLLGTLAANIDPSSANNVLTSSNVMKNKVEIFNETLSIFQLHFIRNEAGFLKSTGDLIKSSTNKCQEIKVGLSYSYVVFVETMGGAWLEKHINEFLMHIIEITANLKDCTSNTEAVFSRKCITFILKNTIGCILSERGQLLACQQLIEFLHKSSDKNTETQMEKSNHNSIICALETFSVLLIHLGTSAAVLTVTNNQSQKTTDIVLNLLMQCSQEIRLAVAWNLRYMCLANPNEISYVIERCITELNSMQRTAEIVNGYCYSLSSILGGISARFLGTPHKQAETILEIAENLLQNDTFTRLLIIRIECGWLLIASTLTLGVTVVRRFLPYISKLWVKVITNSEEAFNEKNSTDTKNHLTLMYNWTGVLFTMQRILDAYPELITSELKTVVLTFLKNVFSGLNFMQNVVKQTDQQMTSALIMVRYQLYSTLLSLLPLELIDSFYVQCIQWLAADICLLGNQHLNITTSIILKMCSTAFGSVKMQLLKKEFKWIENELLSTTTNVPNHKLDYYNLSYLHCNKPEDALISSAVSINVLVVDAAVTFLGQLYSHLEGKHRQQLISYFKHCLKQTKSGRHHSAIETNIFTTLLYALKVMNERRLLISTKSERNMFMNFVLNGLLSSVNCVRYMAGEIVGRTAQAVFEPSFTVELIQILGERLKSARDVYTRTGFSVALGALHRYVGGVGSSLHVNNDVTLLVALSQENTSAEVQTWALNALAWIIDAEGSTFQQCIDSTVSKMLMLLLTVPINYVHIHQAIGKVISAIINISGPELQNDTTSVRSLRGALLTTCALMQLHYDGYVKAEACICLQQLHLFAPKFVHLDIVVPTICEYLYSVNYVLRRAAVMFLRQLTQRESKSICDYAKNLLKDETNSSNLPSTDFGLAGLLFALLDTVNDDCLITHIHNTLLCIIQTLIAEDLPLAIQLCKHILIDGSSSQIMTNIDEVHTSATTSDVDDDDHIEFHDENSVKRSIQSRWPTRVFAAKCLQKIINSYRLDADKFKSFNTNESSTDLLHFLHDLIRISFVTTTSNTDSLRLMGLKILQDIIIVFNTVVDSELPDHSILEQYEAQISAALRPAFTSNTSPLIRAAASKVCSTWICSNTTSGDLQHLHRIYTLLTDSLKSISSSANIRTTPTTYFYTNKVSTIETMAIISAWADCYVTCAKFSLDPIELFITTIDFNENLMALLHSELISVSKFWWSFLKNYALHFLPMEFRCDTIDASVFHCNSITIDNADFDLSWQSILYASALWLWQRLRSTNSGAVIDDTLKDKVLLLYGITLDTLCNSKMVLNNNIHALKNLRILLSSKDIFHIIYEHCNIVDLYRILYRLILTMDDEEVHILCMAIIIQCIQRSFEFSTKHNYSDDIVANDMIIHNEQMNIDSLFAIVEVCVCCITRHIPALNISKNFVVTFNRNSMNSFPDRIVRMVLHTIEKICGNYLANDIIRFLPTILYIVVGILKESLVDCVKNATDFDEYEPLKYSLKCYKQIASESFCLHSDCGEEWQNIIYSSYRQLLSIISNEQQEDSLDGLLILLLSPIVFTTPFNLKAAMNLLNVYGKSIENLCSYSVPSTIKLKYIQVIESLIRINDTDITNKCRIGFGPVILDLLQSYVSQNTLTRNELLLITTSISILNVFLETCNADQLTVLKFFLPILLKTLLILHDSSNDENTILVHKTVIQIMLRIKSNYSNEFKVVLNNHNHFKDALQQIMHLQDKQIGDIPSIVPNGKDNNYQQYPSILLKSTFTTSFQQ